MNGGNDPRPPFMVSGSWQKRLDQLHELKRRQQRSSDIRGVLDAHMKA
jgi:hypothetical protein